MESNVSKMTENSNNLYVGMDIHKKQWSICIRTSDFEHRKFTQPANPILLRDYINQNFPTYQVTCAYEAGCFGFWISEKLQSYGYRCLVLNPADIPGSDKESKQKTDHNDCRKIARELSKGEIKGVFQPDLTQQCFRNLFRQRNQVVKQLRQVKCQIRSLLSFHGILVDEQYENNNWSNAFKKWLQELPFGETNGRQTLDSMLRRLKFLHDEFLLIERELRQYVRTHHRQEYELLRSIPGIGSVVAIAVMSELGDLSRFKTADNLCSYVGLVPNIYQSGDTVRVKGLTNRCKFLLRSYFIESAWVAVGKDPEMIAYYKRHAGKKVAGKIIVKVARKLLLRMYYCMKYQRPYRLNHSQSTTQR